MSASHLPLREAQAQCRQNVTVSSKDISPSMVCHLAEVEMGPEAVFLSIPNPSDMAGF